MHSSHLNGRSSEFHVRKHFLNKDCFPNVDPTYERNASSSIQKCKLGKYPEYLILPRCVSLCNIRDRDVPTLVPHKSHSNGFLRGSSSAESVFRIHFKSLFRCIKCETDANGLLSVSEECINARIFCHNHCTCVAASSQNNLKMFCERK